MGFSIVTGDSADSRRLNETRWVCGPCSREKSNFRPGSGVRPGHLRRSALRRGLALTPRRGDTGQLHRRAGLQQGSAKGANPYFYDPQLSRRPAQHLARLRRGHGRCPGAVAGLPASAPPLRRDRKPRRPAGRTSGRQRSESRIGDGMHRATADGPAAAWESTFMSLSPATLMSLAPSERMLVPTNQRFVSKRRVPRTAPRPTGTDSTTSTRPRTPPPIVGRSTAGARREVAPHSTRPATTPASPGPPPTATSTTPRFVAEGRAGQGAGGRAGTRCTAQPPRDQSLTCSPAR